MESTIIYYTSNREKPEFEQKVRDNILKNSNGLPVVSVSQKPIDFGMNICVGEHDNCYHNEFRQILIGLNAITTPYVLTAEADCLYPPEYFTYIPSEPGKCYRYDNVWIHYTQFSGKPVFRFKGCSDGCQVVDRLMWIDLLSYRLADRPEWSTRNQDKTTTNMMFRTITTLEWTGNPIISFKTRNAVKSSTQIKKDVLPRYELPYWGLANDVRTKYYEN